ncbi:MAG: hypothetical protein AAF901_14400, partial [Bacteroidota bacterium]
MDKFNFVVSSERSMWEKDTPQKFFNDPLDRHLTEVDGLSKEVYGKTASTNCNVLFDLKADDNFVNKKYDKYINIVALRINQLLQTNYPKKFWKKALS